MSRADKNRPNGKPNRRRAGSRTSAGNQPDAKPTELQVAPADFTEDAGKKSNEEISRPSASIEASSNEASAIDSPLSAPVVSSTAAPAEHRALIDGPLNTPAVSAQLVPINMQTIADAYGNYTKKSVEQIWDSMQKLATAPSAAKFLELQMEYAKLACETFIANSQKISELHGELAKQRTMNLEEFLAGIVQITFVLGVARHSFSVSE